MFWSWREKKRINIIQKVLRGFHHIKNIQNSGQIIQHAKVIHHRTRCTRTSHVMHFIDVTPLLWLLIILRSNSSQMFLRIWILFFTIFDKKKYAIDILIPRPSTISYRLSVTELLYEDWLHFVNTSKIHELYSPKLYEEFEDNKWVMYVMIAIYGVWLPPLISSNSSSYYQVSRRLLSSPTL